MEIMTLTAESRTALGTRAARALRKTGRVPAVLYGHGQPVETASLALHDIVLALSQGVRTLQVELGGKSQQYLIKDIQYDYLGHEPIHLDLTRVALDERVQVRVGIELRGVPKGVSEGGVLDQHLADLEVECLVTEIPKTLHPMVTELGLSESLLVKDLELPPGVIALADAEERVAMVNPLMIAEPEVEEAPAEVEKETAEPEVIGRARKEEESEGES